LLSAVAKVLSMYCFSDRYRQRVGSYSVFRLVEDGGLQAQLVRSQKAVPSLEKKL
jgi:hypothetical protein